MKIEAPSITRRRRGATARARRLRQDQTDAEYRLWYRLRGREIGGYKFVRQIPLGPFIVDFLCRSARLVVEIDGEQHADSEADRHRTAWLNRQGYSVPRFWNHEALREREAVLDTILAVLEGRIDGPSPGLRFAPADLSPEGRGFGERRRLIVTSDVQPMDNVEPLNPLPSGERSPRSGG